MKIRNFLPLLSLVGLCAAQPAGAALLAHYDFTDGNLTNDSSGMGIDETLTLVTNGTGTVTTSPEGAAIFPGNDAAADQDYLQRDRSGAGASQFSVSIWFKTTTVNQGNYQGIFSNNIANTAGNFSWQLDVHNGTLRLVSATSGFGSIDNSGVGEPQIQADVWHQVVARKTAANAADLWFGDENGLTQIGTAGANPGGLQYFRLGVNRSSDSLYGMEMANVKIYDDVDVSLDVLNDEGPLLIPEPSVVVPLGLVGFGLLFRRRR